MELMKYLLRDDLPVHSDYTGRERAANQATRRREQRTSQRYSPHWHSLSWQEDCTAQNSIRI